MCQNLERDFVVKFSALEISNEDVMDLLNQESGPLGLLKVPEKGNIVEEVVKDIGHVKRLISNCEAQGQVGETATSDTCSSSHKVIRLTVESCPRGNLGHVKSFIASLNLVDLAGIEPASDINASLRTLRTVIQKLRLHSFQTAMVCAISAALSQVEQSRSTLSFATFAKELFSVPRLVKYVKESNDNPYDICVNPPDDFACVRPFIYRYLCGVDSVQNHSTCKDWRDPNCLNLQIGSGLPPLQLDWEQRSPLLFYFSSGTKWRFLHPLTADIYESDFPLLANAKFHCSRFGWLLMSTDPYSFTFFNPFINRTIDLPRFEHSLIFESTTFTAPPTSSRCRVIILGNISKENPTRLITCTCSRGASSWNQQIITLRFPFQVADCNPVFDAKGKYYQLGVGGNVCIVLSGNDGRIYVTPLPYQEASEVDFDNRVYIWRHEGKLIKVSVGRDGTPLGVFDFKLRTVGTWEPVATFGQKTMFLSKDGAVLVDAKVVDIDDRLYFTKIRKKHRKINVFEESVFYSLKYKCYCYHSFEKDHPCVDLSELEEAGFSRNTWIEPSICKSEREEMFVWSILPTENEDEDEKGDEEDEDEDLDFDNDAFWDQF